MNIATILEDITTEERTCLQSSFATFLKRAADDQDMSRYDIATLAEVSPTTVQAACNGTQDFRLSTVARIARVMGYRPVLTFEAVPA